MCVGNGPGTDFDSGRFLSPEGVPSLHPRWDPSCLLFFPCRTFGTPGVFEVNPSPGTVERGLGWTAETSVRPTRRRSLFESLGLAQSFARRAVVLVRGPCVTRSAKRLTCSPGPRKRMLRLPWGPSVPGAHLDRRGGEDDWPILPQPVAASWRPTDPPVSLPRDSSLHWTRTGVGVETPVRRRRTSRWVVSDSSPTPHRSGT